MDPARWQRLQELFDEAAALTPAERASWLAKLADQDGELADDLGRLLAADEATADQQIGGRIERFAASTLDGDELAPETRVGAYTIDHLLGHGGMGRVYLAHRSDRAYEQQVVIKVVQTGPGERLVRLFERERQILADLNHPNIARLLDGGKLDDHTPYLVMEYVEGTDIVSYCEAREVSLDERLRLFQEVCGAVQYAHAKLVVHRDIKPANVLVNESGRVRLLDFGIATLVRGQGELPSTSAGTEPADGKRTLSGALLSPAFASPEQGRGEPVTTASDIYSLGLLLYRLVCGRLFDQDSACDKPPPTPSALLRQSGHARQARRVAGDLDAIILRALAPDPGQRHTTVAEFSAELGRFLEHRPVQSRPAGAGHRLGLFARRNPGLSLVVGGSSLLITGFAAAMTWLAVQLGEERDQALAARATTDHVAGFMVELFAAADPREHLGDPPDARTLLDRGAQQIDDLDGPPALSATVLQRMAEAYRHIGASDRANALLARALALELPRALQVDIALEQADLWRETGRLEDAEARLSELIETLEASPTTPNALASAYNNYALVLEMLERPEQAEAWVRRALAVDLPDSRASRIDRLAFGNNLALFLARQNQHGEAIDLLDRIIEEKVAVYGPRHPSTLLSRRNQADSYRRTGRLEEAIQVFEQIRSSQVEIHGDPSLAVAEIDNEIANAWHDLGRFEPAEAAYQRAYRFFAQNPQAEPTTHAFVVNNLASLLEDQGELAAAERYFDRSVALREALFPPDSLPYLRGLMNRVRVQIQLGRLEQAGRDLTTIEQALKAHHPDQTVRHIQAALLRAEWLAASGQADEARATLATIDPQFVADQAQNARFARRWQSLQQALQK